MSKIEKVEIQAHVGPNEGRYARVFSMYTSPSFPNDWGDLYENYWEKSGKPGRLDRLLSNTSEFIHNPRYRIDVMESMIARIPGWIPINIDSEAILENREKAVALALLTSFSFGVSRVTDGPSVILIPLRIGRAIFEGDSFPFDEIGLIIGIPAAVRTAAGVGLHIYHNHYKKRDIDLKGAICLSWWPAFYGPILGHVICDRLQKWLWQNVGQAQTDIQDHLVRVLASSELKE